MSVDIKFFRGAHRFLPTLIRMEGFTVVEVPVRHEPRQAGRGHYGVWNRLFKSSADLLAVRWMKTRIIRYKISDTIKFFSLVRWRGRFFSAQFKGVGALCI